MGAFYLVAVPVSVLVLVPVREDSEASAQYAALRLVDNYLPEDLSIAAEVLDGAVSSPSGWERSRIEPRASAGLASNRGR